MKPRRARGGDLMSCFRPESHGFLLSCLVVGVIIACTAAGPVAGAQPLHPIFAPHEDTEIGEGGPTGASAEALGPTPCVNNFAGIYPCRNVDLLSFLPLDQMGAAGQFGSDMWGWTDPQTGREYALMAMSNGASFVDVTDPTAPRYLGY